MLETSGSVKKKSYCRKKNRFIVKCKLKLIKNFKVIAKNNCDFV